MGKKNLTIGEISEILNITPSTLRFWEKENLFHVSKKSNHYRTYTNTDLIDIADILYYRNLGVPVKDIRAFSSLELSEYDQFLENQERELNKKIEEYQQMLLRSQSLKRNYYRLLRWTASWPAPITIWQTHISQLAKKCSKRPSLC